MSECERARPAYGPAVELDRTDYRMKLTFERDIAVCDCVSRERGGGGSCLWALGGTVSNAFRIADLHCL